MLRWFTGRNNTADGTLPSLVLDKDETHITLSPECPIFFDMHQVLLQSFKPQVKALQVRFRNETSALLICVSIIERGVLREDQRHSLDYIQCSYTEFLQEDQIIRTRHDTLQLIRPEIKETALNQVLTNVDKF